MVLYLPHSSTLLVVLMEIVLIDANYINTREETAGYHSLADPRARQEFRNVRPPCPSPHPNSRQSPGQGARERCCLTYRAWARE
jgi:hypothetical protein